MFKVYNKFYNLKKFIIGIVLGYIFFIPMTIFSQDRVKLFYLGGQSNMDGFGYNEDLPDSLKFFDNVWIFHGKPASNDKLGGQGIWDRLKPGHGTGFSHDSSKNKLSNRFGLELSFARELMSIYPDEKVAIIKYSVGGTSIDTLAVTNKGNWDPDYLSKKGINQWDSFLNTLNNAFGQKDIDRDGKEDKLIPTAIVWMQGEGDAKDEKIAKRYYYNLKRLMDLIRAAFRVDDLPVVIVKISDSHNNKRAKVWKYGELVQYAQEKFVDKDKKAVVVRSTKYYKYSDPWHYDSDSYIDLGKKMCSGSLKNWYKILKHLFKI